jgi:hypothetical protein
VVDHAISGCSSHSLLPILLEP